MSSVKKVLGKVRDFANSLKQVYINCKKVVTEIGKNNWTSSPEKHVSGVSIQVIPKPTYLATETRKTNNFEF